MNSPLLDKALLPYENKLRSQERFRTLLGVKEVEEPTYKKYITGPVERFDRRKNAFMFMTPGNPFGQDVRERWKAAHRLRLSIYRSAVQRNGA